MAYSKEVTKRFKNVLSNPNEFNVGKFDPKDPNVATGMTGAPACGVFYGIHLFQHPDHQLCPNVLLP